MTDYITKECDCGAEIQIPADGEKHDAECPKCNLTMVCDEAGDILQFIEHVNELKDVK